MDLIAFCCQDEPFDDILQLPDIAGPRVLHQHGEGVGLQELSFSQFLIEPAKLSLDELSGELARALERRPLMLKLLSMNLYDMEANSRMERLVEFKAAYGESKEALDRCLKQYLPSLGEGGRRTFLYAFLPFVYGLYPYTVVTDKQREAMKEAGISYVYMSTYEMAYAFIRTMLGGLQ